MKRPSLVQRIAYPLIALAIVVAIWQGIVSWWKPPAILLPGPFKVLEAAIAEAPKLAMATFVTLIAALGGFTSSLIIGSCVAMLFSQSAIFRVSFYPYAIFLQTVPIVAVAPIIVIWFGEGTAAVIVIAFMVILFPIITNGTTGMIAIPSELQDLFALNGATRWQTLSKLQFPHALPHLVTGAKISSGLSVLGAIVAPFTSHWVGWWSASVALGVYSLLLQRFGHSLERAKPTSTGGTAASKACRLVVEQFVTFPRFVLSGGWTSSWRQAPRLAIGRRRGRFRAKR